MGKDYRAEIQKKIMLSTILIVSFVFLILSFAVGCSGGDDNNGSGTANEITGTVDESGGVFEAGQIMVDFPAGSVNSEVSITGTAVFPNGLPEYITPLSSVYKIILSDPGAYSSDSAVLTFNLLENPEGKGVSIYHSTDGVVWNELESIVEGNAVSASIPNFSYFVVAKSNYGAGDLLYSLEVINRSSVSWNACLYQNDSKWTSSRIYPVAWKSRNVLPGSTITYQWRKNYAFCWARTGVLQPGISFRSYQIINGDLNSYNKITLTNEGSSFYFTNLTSSGVQGSMTIYQDLMIPFREAAIGLAMEGSAFCAAQASPNQQTSFFPANTKYFITMGNYQMGQVLDTSSVAYSTEIVFPEGIYSLTATYNADGSWTITPGTEAGVE